MAINDVMSKFDGTVREPLKMLQLAGNCNLEAVLELAKSKMTENSLSGMTCSSATSSDGSRIERLEKMMESIVSNMAGANIRNKNVTCEVCGKSNHTRNACFKLKTCFLCNTKGHISRFSPKKA